jgi:signal transduction histidine kinase
VAGTGLGLAIASRITTTLGGTLECDSSPGKGSRFTLRLSKV